MAVTAQELADLMPDMSQLESNEPEMESSLHYAQLALLVACLEWLWRDRNDFFIGANLTIYFSREQLKNRDFRGPDFFYLITLRKSRADLGSFGKKAVAILTSLLNSSQNPRQEPTAT